MKEVEDLIIYKQYVELIYYTEMITKKYPKGEKLSLVSTIKNTTYKGLNDILVAFRAFQKEEKIKLYIN